MSQTKKDAPRDFAVIIAEMPDANIDAARELQRVVEAVRDTGKAGALTIKISVGLAPGAQGGQGDRELLIKPSVTPTIPKHDSKSRMFYADDENNIQRNDPTTMPLFQDTDIKDAPAHHPTTGEIKEV